jgi:SAM-dependent methyltransferase
MINWHDRYAKLLGREPDLFDAGTTVLEVGCGPWGIALWLQRPVIGLDKDHVEPRDALLEIVRGDATCLPFDDASFDYVVCVDVLEHLASDQRASALRELIRVARRKALVTCPCGASARDAEAALAGLFDDLGMPLPDWLTEHLEHGLPDLGSLLETVTDAGHGVDVVGNESRMQHFAGLLLNITMTEAAGWNIEHAAKCVREPPIGESHWDRYYSYLITVDKQARTTAGRETAFPALPHPDGVAATPTAALYAVVHDPSLMLDIAPLRYVVTRPAAGTVLPPCQPPPLFASGTLDDRRWSELSAVYTVWKDGPRTDVVGFCHYRRLFDFGPPRGDERETTVSADDLATIGPDLAFDDVLPRVASGALLVARPLDLGESVFDNYCRYHRTDDYLLLLGVVADLHPELLPFMLEDFRSPLLYGNNMFVAPWQLFDDLCSTWFPLLEEWCSRAEDRRASGYQHRDVSFLSERLFSAWVKYVRSHGVAVDEKPIFFVDLGLPAETSVAASLDLARQAAQPAGDALRTARQELEVERARGRELQRALSASTAEMAQVVGSMSWRVTAPLRGAARAARRAATAVRDRSHTGGSR